jgi:sortase A
LKKIAFLLMLIGISLVVYAGWNIYDMNKAQQESLAKAKEIITDSNQANSADKQITLDNFHPKKGDVIGIVRLPKIESELPIVEGTSEDELEVGVGHYSDTALPGQNDQILLSGHRDTVFRRLGELEIGDKIIVEMPYGTFTYKIYHTKIVPADDTTIIGSTFPKEVLNISTCYPFRYIGNAPDRYIIYAEPVN